MRGARRLMAYPSDSAGGLMITEMLSYRDDLTVGDVLDDLRANADDIARTMCSTRTSCRTTESWSACCGFAICAVAAGPSAFGGDDPRSAQGARQAGLEELERFFDRHPLLGVPAVDAHGVLMGVVRSADVEQAAEERSNRSFLKFMGIVGGEELRSMPLRHRSMRRLSWLTVNIVLNIVAASVIAFHQDTLTAVIALAVFLPIISDMSGCSGNQAVAVSMRELTLGVIRPRELWRVFRKEAAVGMINGIVLGMLLGWSAWRGRATCGWAPSSRYRSRQTH